MKKYIIRNADGSEQTVMRAIHNSRKEAGRVLMRYLSYNNESRDVDSHLSPFDFILEEVECGDINEVITDFESAREMLGLKALGFLNKFDDVTKLISDINPKHIEALIALNKLFTLAEAWNKEDNFIPDFSDANQHKYFPWFKYDENIARFVHVSVDYTCKRSARLGSRICFKTFERAEQFGKQFVDLYNKIFL
mgnify:CR=1 FL=1